MTTVAQKLRERQSTGFSIEIVPPLKGGSINKVFNSIDSLKEFDPLYINITTHHSEPVYVTSDDGKFRKQFIRKRPGTVAVAAAIQQKYGVPAVPHIICSGFTRDETEYVLIDLNFLDIHDILVLRGDMDKETLVPSAESHAHATDLIGQINSFNQGQFLDGTMCEPIAKPFSFGVAGYPEKHEEAPNMDIDLMYLKQKVDMGAEYVVTQMFFDNQKYYDFVDRARKAGITVPIIPGLKPLTRKRQLNVLPKIFSSEIPVDFANAIMSCKTDDDVKRVGIEWMAEQCRDLMARGVPNIHFYVLANADCVRAVAEKVY